MLNPLRHPSEPRRTCALRKCVLNVFTRTSNESGCLLAAMLQYSLRQQVIPESMSAKTFSFGSPASVWSPYYRSRFQRTPSLTLDAQKSRKLPDLDLALARSRLFPLPADSHSLQTSAVQCTVLFFSGIWHLVGV